MPFNYHRKLIINGLDLYNMPPMEITKRVQDLYIEYSKRNNRFDRIAANVYSNDEMAVLIRWANPEYDLEFDIPDGNVIRVPLPLEDVLDEVFEKIEKRKDK
jgi:hypothetical protein